MEFRCRDGSAGGDLLQTMQEICDRTLKLHVKPFMQTINITGAHNQTFFFLPSPASSVNVEPFSIN